MMPSAIHLHAVTENKSFMFLWLALQWKIYNFIDCGILDHVIYDTNNFNKLIKDACLHNNEHFIKELIDCYPDIANKYYYGDTLLHIICRSSVRADCKARLILRNHRNLNSELNVYGSLPIHIAAINQNPKICKELIKAGQVDINATTRKNLTALHIASHFGIKENVEELLLDNDIDMNIVDSNGDTALHHSAGKGQFIIYTRLANDPRCDTSIRNNRCRRAVDDLSIHLTRYVLNESYAKFLLLADALTSLRIYNKDGHSPLHLSITSTQDGLEKFEYLIKRDSFLLTQSNHSENCPIHVAASVPDKRFLEYLLSLKNIYVNINSLGYRERTPLHMACFKGYPDHVDLLLHDYDTYINAKDIDGNTSLHIACSKGYYDVVKKLMSFSWCNIDIKNNQNKTPWEVSTNFVKIAQITDRGTVTDLQTILERAAVEYYDRYGNNLLHICASSKCYAGEKAKLLFHQNLEMVSRTNGKEYMPIHTATEENNVDVVDYLVTKGCLNSMTFDKQSPLHIASQHGSNLVLSILLKCENVHVNIQDNNKNTPAHLAAEAGHIDTLCLIENHPNYVRGIINKQGLTPYDTCPALNALKVILIEGSVSNFEAMLKCWGKYLTMPVKIMLLPLLMKIETERAGKIAVLANRFKELIEQYTDSFGNSIVHLALFKKDANFLKALINSLSTSCVINARDQTGWTSWDYASVKEDLEFINLLESHPRFEQSCVGLNVLRNSTLIETSSTVLSNYSYTLHRIKDELWCCDGAITIYSVELKEKRRICKGDIDEIYSVVPVHGRVAVASAKGLFILRYSGEQIKQITNNDVYDVRYHSGQLFCVVGESQGKVVIQTYDSHTFHHIREIKSPCGCRNKYRHTLHVGSEYITLECLDANIIHIMTHSGEAVLYPQLCDFKWPRLCHTGSDTILVADWGNHCLKLLSQGEWAKALLEPPPSYPTDAVYAGGSLFVLSGLNWSRRITKYTPNS